jgi:hypothetical protein
MKFKRKQLEDKMGLDMYLNAKRFLWHSETELANKVAELLPEINGKRVKEITIEAMYWRKSNMIHKWFVDNVQDGEDDCGNYEVSREKLQELVDIISKVLADKSQAGNLLPNQGGFFFGSQDYDKYYFEDLEDTKRVLEGLLGNEDLNKHWYFEYHSSW